MKEIRTSRMMRPSAILGFVLALTTMPLSAIAARAPSDASSAIIGTGSPEAIIGTGTQAIIGTGTQAMIGTGTQAIIGTGKQAIIGTGSREAIIGTGTQAIIGTGSPEAIIGTGTQAIIGTGSPEAIIGTGTQAIIGTGKQAIIGTGSPEAIIGTGTQAIIGTGSQVSAFELVALGPIDYVEDGAVTVLGQRVDTTNAVHLSEYSPGAVIAVFGMWSDAGIIASEVMTLDSSFVGGSTQTYLAGPATSVPSETGVVQIGDLEVQIAAAGADPVAWDVAEGDFVEVTGTYLDGRMYAEELATR